MSNDTARQIEEMARLFVESAVEVLGGEGAGTFDTMKPHERAECMKLISAFHARLHAVGYTKPTPAARPSAEEIAEALDYYSNPSGPKAQGSKAYEMGAVLAAALRAVRMNGCEMSARCVKCSVRRPRP